VHKVCYILKIVNRYSDVPFSLFFTCPLLEISLIAIAVVCIIRLAASEGGPIKVTLPDGSIKEAVAGKTTPYDIALSISKGLAENSVVAKVRKARM